MNTGGWISFGQWLKNRRKSFDITQEELGDRVGCSEAAIQKIESGERRPSRQIAEVLADFFKIPHDERTAFTHFARAGRQVEHAEADGEAPWRTLRHRQSN